MLARLANCNKPKPFYLRTNFVKNGWGSKKLAMAMRYKCAGNVQSTRFPFLIIFYLIFDFSVNLGYEIFFFNLYFLDKNNRT